MYCERCNIDFPEGLRYCKWCGGGLVKRRRVTSELIACPTCASTVQPEWTFCKSCGVKLAPESGKLSGIICSKCGAEGESGALYCLQCGERLEQSPAPEESGGAERLICGVCNRPSPAGSGVCEHCGASFTEAQAISTGWASGFDADGPEKTDTLPDLADHLPESTRDYEQTPTDGISFLTPNEDETVALDESVSASLQPPAGAVSSEETDAAEMEEPAAEDSGSKKTPMTVFIQKRKVTNPVHAQEQQEESEDARTSSQPLDTRLELPAIPQSEDEPPPAKSPTTSRLDASEEPPAFDPMEATQEISAGSIDPQAWSQSAPFVFEDEEDEIAAAPEEKSQTEAFTPTQEFTFAETEDEAEIPPPDEEAGLPYTDALASRSDSEMEEAGTQTGDLYQMAPPDPEPVTDAKPYQPEQTHQQQAWSPAQVPIMVEESPPAEKKTWMLIASSVVVVLILAVTAYMAWWFIWSDGRPEPQAQTVEAPPIPVAPPSEPPAAPVAPEGMLLVEGGTYTIGRDDGDELGKPAHSVTLSAFYIDRTEVTNAAYKAFIDATGRKAPKDWEGGTYRAGQDEWPVTGVTWQDAADYAAWAGKRLPTEEEWEAAARGKDGLIYPWGNDWDASRANVGNRRIQPVGQYESGKSPAGALDMIGNVWEWTVDEMRLYPSSPASQPDDMEPGVTYRVIRGGAYDGSKIHTASYRGYVDASKGLPKTGFRCVKDASKN